MAYIFSRADRGDTKTYNEWLTYFADQASKFGSTFPSATFYLDLGLKKVNFGEDAILALRSDFENKGIFVNTTLRSKGIYQGDTFDLKGGSAIVTDIRGRNLSQLDAITGDMVRWIFGERDRDKLTTGLEALFGVDKTKIEFWIPTSKSLGDNPNRVVCLDMYRGKGRIILDSTLDSDRAMTWEFKHER